MISFRKNTVANNFVWLFVGRVLFSGLAFLVVRGIARALGPVYFGELNYYLAIVMMFTYVTPLGLDVVVVHELLDNREHRDSIVGTAVALRLLSGIVGIAGAVLAVFMLGPVGEHNGLCLVGLISVMLLFQPFAVLDLQFQADDKSRYRSITRLIAKVVTLSLVIYFSMAEKGIYHYALVLTVDMILDVCLLLVINVYEDRGVSWFRFDRVWAGKLLSRSWWLILGTMLYALHLKVDQVMLGKLSTPSELGLYSAAIKVSELVYFVPAMVMIAVFPMIVKQWKAGREAYFNRIRQVSSLLFVMSLSFALSVYLGSEYIVDLIFGMEFHGASTILSIHIWGAIFVFWGFVVGRYLIVENLQRFSPLRDGLGLAINVGLNLALIPRYGGVGAAVSTVISYAFSGFLFCFVFPDMRDLGKLLLKSTMIWKRPGIVDLCISACRR